MAVYLLLHDPALGGARPMRSSGYMADATLGRSISTYTNRWVDSSFRELLSGWPRAAVVSLQIHAGLTTVVGTPVARSGSARVGATLLLA